MVPAHQPCPTASVSRHSSARTRQPPFTTPPGCSSSRSGSGLVSPPFSRPLKSSLPSVPLIFITLLSSALSSCLLTPGFMAWVWLLACQPLNVCLWAGQAYTPLSNLSWRLMEDFFKSNLLEYCLWEILIWQDTLLAIAIDTSVTWVGSCNGG